MTDATTMFWEEAYAAIDDGLVTLEEVKIIRQSGRKAVYVNRHLRNLRELIEERRSKRDADTTTIGDSG